MRLRTIGHATLILSESNGTPILATDPWLIGSAYWRSWWLEHYPSEDELNSVAAARFIYITHEHPDHLHVPSLRRIGTRPEILVPDFLNMQMDVHLKEHGFRVRRLPPKRWISLSEGVRLCSIPNWCNDSILLIDTPDALIINLNDAKPGRGILRQLRDVRDLTPKSCVVLRSYSPASPYNICFRNGERIVRGSKANYARAASRAAAVIGASDFIPFASQAVFRRSDSQWANEFKVSLADLKQHWSAKARLLPPFCDMDLRTRDVTFVDPADYNRKDSRERRARIADSERQSAAITLSDEDRNRLTQQLGEIRWLLAVLLPNGFSIICNEACIRYDPKRNRLLDAERTAGHFSITFPALPLIEALRFGHLGDLCIPMFTRVDLLEDINPRRIDAFFMLLILRDYGYLGSLSRLIRWCGWTLRQVFKKIKPIPIR